MRRLIDRANMRKKIKFFIGLYPINNIAVFVLKLFGLSAMSRRVELCSSQGLPVCLNVPLAPSGDILMLPKYNDVNDQIVHQNHIYGWSSFEKPLPLIIFQMMKHCRSFVDVGANTGFYSLLASLHVDKKIISFEPFPAVFDCLQKNINLNSKQDEIETIQLALSDVEGESDLFIPLSDHGLIETSASLNQCFKDDHENVVTVSVKPLDVFLSDRPMENLDLMKVDVESFEKQVLQGSLGTVKKYRPIVILEILNGDNVHWFKQFLKDNDYIAYSIRNDIEENNELDLNPLAPNFIFCPKEKTSLITKLSLTF